MLRQKNSNAYVEGKFYPFGEEQYFFITDHMTDQIFLP